MIGVGKFQFGARALAAAILLLCATAAVDSAHSAGCVPGSTGDPWYQGCTNEANWNYSIAQIKAQAAWNRGYTGQGTVTAVFDSGIDTTDNQFIGRIEIGRASCRERV